MKSTEAIQVKMTDGLAVVTLVQPSRGNPIDGEFARDLRNLTTEFRECKELRAVLLCAEGANFSFGGDLKVFNAQLDRLSSLVLNLTADLHVALQRFWALPVPIVAAVQGYAMGGALSFVAGCDVVIASESVKLGSAFAGIGFSCDSGSSVTLSARMGTARARRFVLLGEVLDGEDALAAGLIDRVVPDDQLQNEALALATTLASGPTAAYGEIKRLFHEAGGTLLEKRMEDEARTLGRLASTPDAAEGIAALVSRRKPLFQGRD